ncbi:hypothetical protein HK099_006854 [Clydaea vesicula]|uniref:tRNA:m(4)X modification enzyme TRM13 n=1 Tax=Clydaea vesicula TaxID=447962 RepID=A0AAD5XXZ3_9FUNG|nr:hypothetical protein HK099_006854 [Clydaea vesicula]
MRYCRFKRRKDSEYCAEHSKDRVPCPLDPKHTCERDGIQQHVSKCNSKPKPRDVYFKENVNIGLNLGENLCGTSGRNLLVSLSNSEFKSFIKKIDCIFEKYERLGFLNSAKTYENNEFQFRVSTSKHQSMQHAETKHGIQQSSLLHLMEENNFLSPSNAFIEFGAGKGELSNCIQQAIGGGHFFLIDRNNFKMKADRLLHQSKTFLKRLTIDIKDLNISCIDELKDKGIIGVSKHLCDDFKMLCTMTSWYTCGNGKRTEQKEIEEVDEHTSVSTEEDTMEEKEHFSGLSSEIRKTIGFKCKRIIDLGRIEYLKNCGFQVEIVKYVDEKVSVENLVLIAKPD